MRIFLNILAALWLLTQAQVLAANEPLRVLVMGDSFMTSNGSARQSVPHVLERLLNTKVKSTAVTGARHLYKLPITGSLGLNISKQYRRGNWDYVVMNGGGNDLLLGCGCGPCTRKMKRLISEDGRRGAIPSVVMRARQSGAQVIYVGYLRSPGRGSPVEGCRPLGDTLEARIARLAARDPGVRFVSLADMVPRGDGSFHAADMIHPSPKGSAAAAKRIVTTIRQMQ